MHTNMSMCGLEAPLSIEFEMELLQVVIDSHSTKYQSIRYRLTTLEELDERTRMGTQHIEAIQR